MPGRRFFCRRGAEAAEETGGGENEGRAEEAAAAAKSAGEPRRGRGQGEGRRKGEHCAGVETGPEIQWKAERRGHGAGGKKGANVGRY